MSGFGTSDTSGGPSAFFSFDSTETSGRKSATAAALTMTSALAARSDTAALMSMAVLTGITSAPGGHGSSVGPATRVTFAPRRVAAAAIAYPIRPDDRLPMNLTGSIGSWVPPAVTSILVPSRS
jgi:hypothetical protein